MIVKFDLDPKLVSRIEDAAERLGVPRHEYVAALLTQPLRGGWSTSQAQGEVTRREIVRLHGEGFTDEEIAARVGRVREHVARLRRAAGLRPNKRKKVA